VSLTRLHHNSIAQYSAIETSNSLKCMYVYIYIYIYIYIYMYSATEIAD
jgi:hypothetical protein